MVKEILCKAMAEGVGIDHISIDTILLCKVFELLGYTTCCDAIAKTIEKNIPRG